MNALELVKAERKRQIEVEGWTPEHDDEHRDGEMLSAANFYYLNATGRSLTFRDDGAPLGWRWEASWWKPKTPVRDLVRAGALCIAEMDRLRRIRDLSSITSGRSTARYWPRWRPSRLRSRMGALRHEPGRGRR